MISNNAEMLYYCQHSGEHYSLSYFMRDEFCSCRGCIISSRLLLIDRPELDWWTNWTA
jgi:hypothetical protein